MPALARLISLALLLLAPVASAAETPNVVLFYCDDMGYADIGPYGGKAPTPNIDRLAAEGVKFTDFYVAQAVCSASRAALITGCYNLRVGITGALGPKSKIGINPDERTLAEVFKSKGYATAMYGKWHLGDAPKFLPINHGFDEWFGVPYSHDMWPRHPASPKAWPDLPLMENDKVLKLNPEPGELTGAITDRAVKFIERSKDKPFFVYIPHPLPHVPLGVSKAFEGKTGKGLHADVIAEIDHSVGSVLEAIKKAGIDEKTLVMFSSDNGPWLLYGDHAGSALPLREGKATAFDGGVRVPFLARWPGKIAPGSVCKEVAATIDVLPTMARLIGAAGSDKKIDGLDIWPLMTQPATAKSPHEFYAIYWGRELHAIRSGKWKLHFAHAYPKPAPPGGSGKPGKYANLQIGDELFDLEADIGEEKNVASANPDVVAKLQKFAQTIREDLGESRTKQAGGGVREPGKI
ncbi:sulfatase family protein [Humisphaera borealis]|uniref:Sulfatase n=1 Tax=Humisphaera borealis TaxID=2807512 RepID=A0A7M2WR00_9BACT|nr:sulfatase [Humisphaera borealis]QOV87839.1 sulfatase [Humisphaera borealis]